MAVLDCVLVVCPTAKRLDSSIYGILVSAIGYVAFSLLVPDRAEETVELETAEETA